VTSKIKIHVGDIEVEYEGPESFLDKKLTALVSQLSVLHDQLPKDRAKKTHHSGASSDNSTIIAILKSKSATSNQTKKFLAAAEWLHLRGQTRLKTGDVTKALRDNSQAKIGNPAQTLIRNVTNGHCERDGKSFFVTDEGRAELG